MDLADYIRKRCFRKAAEEELLEARRELAVSILPGDEIWVWSSNFNFLSGTRGYALLRDRQLVTFCVLAIH
jgi:hypothetical protein